MRHWHLVNTPLLVIFTNQHPQKLGICQNQTAIGVTPDPFFLPTITQKKRSGHTRLDIE